MLMVDLTDFRAPGSNARLTYSDGKLLAETGEVFAVRDGVPDLTWPPELSCQESATLAAYDEISARIYDVAMKWQFAAIKEEEDTVRESMVDLLDPKADSRVLEVGCGSGRDSFRIARRLSADGALTMQDLSAGMMRGCVGTMEHEKSQKGLECKLQFCVSNALYLPFADGVFDRVFHFGGINEFSEPERAIAEMTRVTKPGGKIVFGDEGVAPWLKNREFGRIVAANNRLMKSDVPLGLLPESARSVSVRWIMANCFYLIAFEKGDGPPPLDMDLAHEGRRGGTLRTRYFGVMEGVDPETKEMARKQAEREGMSMSDWLNRTVLKAALRDD